MADIVTLTSLQMCAHSDNDIAAFRGGITLQTKSPEATQDFFSKSQRPDRTVAASR
jgi:hypothetical protein